jgi:hypothetical protein
MEIRRKAQRFRSRGSGIRENGGNVTKKRRRSSKLPSGICFAFHGAGIAEREKKRRGKGGT